MAMHLSQFFLVRYGTIISIIILIIISVYYLNSTLELLKKLIDHIQDTDAAFERTMARNMTLGKIMFEPLQRNANDMFEKHEPAIVVNVITYGFLIVVSLGGLVVALRKKILLLIIYGLSLNLIYFSSFLYLSRVQSSVCALLVFVSIVSYLHAYDLWRTETKSAKVCILQATPSDRELIKNMDRNFTKFDIANKV